MTGSRRRAARRGGGVALVLAGAVVLAGCAPGAEDSARDPDGIVKEDSAEERVDLPAPTPEQLAAAVPSGESLADYGWVFAGSRPAGEPDIVSYAEGSCFAATLSAVEPAGPDGYPEYVAQLSSFTRNADDTLSFEVRHYPEADPLEVMDSLTALAECEDESIETNYGTTVLRYTPADPAPEPAGDAVVGVVANVDYLDYPEYGTLLQSDVYVACGDLLLLVTGGTAGSVLAPADITPAVDRALATVRAALGDRC